MKTVIFAALAAALPFAAMAHDGMAVKDAYARGANPKSGAAFMLIENHRKIECTLSGVASEIAERVELHSNSEVDGVMKMQPLKDGITIPAEGEHRLQRGGDHVMMMGLKAPLEDGKSVKMVLDFGDCGTQELEIPVDNERSDDASHGADAHDGGDDHAGH